MCSKIRSNAKEAPTFVGASQALVPRTGLEPAQPFGHTPLKRACLPISPPGQAYSCRTALVRGGKYSSRRDCREAYVVSYLYTGSHIGCVE